MKEKLLKKKVIYIWEKGISRIHTFKRFLDYDRINATLNQVVYSPDLYFLIYPSFPQNVVTKILKV